MYDISNKQAHLEMIQGVINRLAHNSFLLKSWSVILVSSLFALAANDTKPTYILLAYFPVIMFWLLDGYFLYNERLFRKLYDSVRVKSEDTIDFSMDTSPFIQTISSLPAVVLSKNIIMFHGVIIFVIIMVMILA